MDVNVVASANPIQSKAQFLQQALEVPESNVASALFNALKRLFWARHSSLPAESASPSIKAARSASIVANGFESSSEQISHCKVVRTLFGLRIDSMKTSAFKIRSYSSTQSIL
jgi:hypothetical protein